MTELRLLLELFLTFFQIGLFTFGGGYAMIPMIQDAVLRKGWMTEKELIDFIAISESTPGPFAVNIATYVGAETSGILGSSMATLGVVLPSFFIILLIARFYEKFRKQRLVADALNGIKPVVIGLIAAAFLSVAKKAFFVDGISLDAVFTKEMLISVIIAVILMFLKIKKMKAIGIVASSALAGILAGFI